MRETLQNTYQGYATTIKNKSYFSTRQYVEPFINAVSTFANKHICEVKLADQLEGNGTHVIYNRVLVMSICNTEYDFTINDVIYHRVVCMTYTLDTKKPICKFYTGVVDPDLNFYAFGDNCMAIQEMEADTAINYSPVQVIFNNGLRDNCRAMLEQLSSISVPKSTNLLGDWVDFALKKEYFNEAGKVRLSTSLPIDAYRTLTMDQDADLYVEDDSISLLHILKTFSSFISEDGKDLSNRYEKTQLVNRLLEL
jgi:hypothetical protein